MALPPNSPSDLLGFLDEHLKTREDLRELPFLVARIDRECLDLESGLRGLEKNLQCALVSWISRSEEFRKALLKIDISRDGNVEGVRTRRARKIIDEELPLLVREVNRIETVRLYAETTLQLEVLVGDLEDTVISIMNAADSGLKHEKLLLAINATKDIEKVLPIAARIEFHFSKWSDEPKFIFALVYKVTRDFLEGVDNILQPLIDEARLVGYSAKESWASAMVKMLCQYLEREIFPVLARLEVGSDSNREATSSWLHLVDIMISFDKQMQILASSGNTLLGMFAGFEGFSQSLTVMSIFSEHSNWLQIWAGIELKYAGDKLRSELEDERSWTIHIAKQAGLSDVVSSESFLLSTREDHKAPSIAESVVRLAWAMIERCRSLPSASTRISFVRSSVTIFLYDFFSHLSQRCQEIESTTSIQEDDMLLRVAGSMNVARYLECVMREWSEDLTFLEMSVTEDDLRGRQNMDQYLHNCFFRDEIFYLVKLETDYLMEIVSALLLDFDALCWDYIQNRDQWARQGNKYKDKISDEENSTVSPDFIEALDMLKERMRILNMNLNVKPFCARPEAFFPCTMDALRLLTMKRKDLDYLLKVLSKGEKNINECLHSGGLFHISAGHVEKILWNIKVEATDK
ncbi:hypothetical protein J5N97_014536 [Dioscorea zingiberensis]|uniref:RINT1-like protein MAG2L n=1 Tax=Dioscorea zingiberensis TaxID=325984 RepID=A0A9D5CUY7_9LILI|nr:hypothetical protein J5N97_014536 [Dioscorea zingiberensis]